MMEDLKMRTDSILPEYYSKLLETGIPCKRASSRHHLWDVSHYPENYRRHPSHKPKYRSTEMEIYDAMDHGDDVETIELFSENLVVGEAHGQETFYSWGIVENTRVLQDMNLREGADFQAMLANLEVDEESDGPPPLASDSSDEDFGERTCPGPASSCSRALERGGHRTVLCSRMPRGGWQHGTGPLQPCRMFARRLPERAQPGQP